MTWFAWRQFRTPAWIAVAALTPLVVVLLVSARQVGDAFTEAGVAACGGNCADNIDAFLRQATESGISGFAYNQSLNAMHVVPVLIGIFWGVPMVAREIETGAYRLTWTQSVTRTRWLATKLAIIGAATVAVVGLLSWAVTSWAQRIDDAAADRISPTVFATRGILPLGYALFALAVGVTAGILIRRSVPAMAATLGVYVVVVVTMMEWVREHLVAAVHLTRPLDMSSLSTVIVNPYNGELVIEGATPDAGWILSNQTVTSTGAPFTGPVDPEFCGLEAGRRTCDEWILSLDLEQSITYHPASHFWPLQWAETGVLIGLAVLLIGFCVWFTRNRLT